MLDAPDLASAAALLGDRTRATMVSLLMDGRAHTATELALMGGVAPSTASSHLARLTAGGLLSITRQGRHRYYRLANEEVARVVEGLTRLAPVKARATVRPGPADEALRRARICYDHLAGTLAVRFLDRLREERLVAESGEVQSLTPKGGAWFRDSAGVDVDALAAGRRPLIRTCLDWSERRDHLAGALGAAVLEHLLATRYARRLPDSRAVVLSARGERLLEGR